MVSGVASVKSLAAESVRKSSNWFIYCDCYRGLLDSEVLEKHRGTFARLVCHLLC